MMVKLDPASKKPIYEQIVQEVKSLVMTGKLLPHEQVLSVRKAAKELGVNPNTVQNHTRSSSGKASFTCDGKGDFVADNAARIKGR